MPTKAEQESWNIDPDAAYAEALRRVEEARQTGAAELVFAGDNVNQPSLRALSRLPPLNDLSTIIIVHLEYSNVSDLTPLATLTTLQMIWMDGTPVASLEPLAALKNLHTLGLDNTGIFDLQPLSGLLNLSNLSIEGTQVFDLSPIAHLHRLGDVAGLFCRGIPAVQKDPVFAELFKLSHVERVRQILLYLNGKHPKYGGPPAPAAPPNAPGQSPAPITARLHNGHIDRDDPAAPEHEVDMARLHAYFRAEITNFEGGLSNQPQLFAMLSKVGGALGETYADTDQLMVGVHSRAVVARARTASEELLPDTAAELEGFAVNLDLFVQRLSAWRDHVAKATAEAIPPEEIQAGTEAARSLLDTMRAMPELFSARVTEIADDLYLAMADGAAYGVEAPYGFYRSLMNVMIVVAQAAMDTLPAEFIREETAEAKKALRKNARSFVHKQFGDLMRLTTALTMWKPLAAALAYIEATFR